ncbi:ClpP family protease [Egicoccus sp. AB-alg2]|uniref:ClpP family protease n=1 Tax=Egicoccus sp. AB-alg2 TaxID=3242693 RepID=UPI00359E9E70
MSSTDVPPRAPEPGAPEPDAPEPPRPPAVTDPIGAMARLSPYERLFEQRVVFLRGALEETTADDLVAQLLALDHDSDQPITLLIDSPGGNTFGMFALHDVMASLRSPVHTRCVGLAASAGAFLLATGTGIRSATANASIMFHQPWGGTGRRTAIDIAKQAAQFADTRRRMQAILAERTGQDYERIRRDLDRDHWLTADEALAYGAIDEVIGTAPRVPAT